MNRRLGRHAQDKFKSLCSKFNVTCNPSIEDDVGWDFILEIPAPETKNISSDKLPTNRQALVQVKSTTGKRRSTTMKVSNALNLARFESPCSIVFFHEYPAENGHIYARHFWSSLIELSLRKGRTASANGKEPHKTKMRVGFSDSDNHSDNLVEWIVSTVNGLPSDYALEKVKLYKSIGYEEHGFRGKVTIKLTEGIQDWVDHQLGLKESLPATEIELMDMRFGIETPHPLPEAKGARISIQPHPIEDLRILLRSGNDRVISLPSTLTIPHLPGIEIKDQQSLVRSWMMDILLLPERKINITFNVQFQESLPLAKLIQATRFFSWPGNPIDFKLFRKDTIVMGSRIDLPPAGDECYFRRLAEFAETLEDIASQAGRADLSLSITDLDESFSNLTFLSKFLADPSMKLTFGPDNPTNVLRNTSYVLAYTDIAVKDLYFFIVLKAPVRTQSEHDNRIQFDLGERILLDCLVGEDARALYNSGMEAYNRWLTDTGDEYLALGDLGQVQPL